MSSAGSRRAATPGAGTPAPSSPRLPARLSTPTPRNDVEAEAGARHLSTPRDVGGGSAFGSTEGGYRDKSLREEIRGIVREELAPLDRRLLALEKVSDTNAVTVNQQREQLTMMLSTSTHELASRLNAQLADATAASQRALASSAEQLEAKVADHVDRLNAIDWAMQRQVRLLLCFSLTSLAISLTFPLTSPINFSHFLTFFYVSLGARTWRWPGRSTASLPTSASAAARPLPRQPCLRSTRTAGSACASTAPPRQASVSRARPRPLSRRRDSPRPGGSPSTDQPRSPPPRRNSSLAAFCHVFPPKTGPF